MLSPVPCSLSLRRRKCHHLHTVPWILFHWDMRSARADCQILGLTMPSQIHADLHTSVIPFQKRQDNAQLSNRI